MNDYADTRPVPFLPIDGNVYPDTLTCSGILSDDRTNLTYDTP